MVSTAAVASLARQVTGSVLLPDACYEAGNYGLAGVSGASPTVGIVGYHLAAAGARSSAVLTGTPPTTSRRSKSWTPTVSCAG